MALSLWGSWFTAEAVAVLGDNTSALQNALDCKGKGVLRAIARRRARFEWRFEVGHLPSEANTLADALSRLHDPSPAAFPTAALRDATRCDAPSLKQFWRAR